jgi:hypothetical protein
VSDATGAEKAAYRQSTFHGASLSPAKLRRREAGFMPQPTPQFDVDRFALSLMDGRTRLGEIAAALQARFPQRFTRPQDALTHAADLAERYHSG